MSQAVYVMVVIAVCLTSSLQSLAQRLDATAPSPIQVYEKTFTLGDHPMLILENSSVGGNIELHSWDRPEIKITAEIHSENTMVHATPAQGVLTVRLRRKGPVSAEPVHFWIWAPARCQVHLSSLSGKIVVRGIRAPLKAFTTDGDIELSEVSGQTVDATSSTSGNITLSGPLNYQGKYHLYSAMGRINVMFKDSASFTLDAATGTGRIQLDGFTLTNERRSERHIEGTYGDGRAILMLRTVQGLIRLQKQ